MSLATLAALKGSCSYCCPSSSSAAAVTASTANSSFHSTTSTNSNSRGGFLRPSLSSLSDYSSYSGAVDNNTSEGSGSTTEDDDGTTGSPVMGNAASAAPTREQQDLKYLGDRFPFGDAELAHLYRSFYYYSSQQQQQQQQEEAAANENDNKDPSTTSFFADWAVRTVRQTELLRQQRRARQQAQQARSPQQQGQQQQQRDPLEAAAELRELVRERRLLLEVLEQQTLPVEFGNRLYERAFLANGDASAYGRTTSAASAGGGATGGVLVEDEYTRLSRLEAFFEGLSNSSRRGAKATLTVLHSTCQSRHDFRYVSALEFVAIGYRLAIATAFLRTAARAAASSQNEDDDEADEDDVVVPQDYLLGGVGVGGGADESDSRSAESTGYHVGLPSPILKQLQAFAQSIVERGKARRQRSGNGSDSYMTSLSFVTAASATASDSTPPTASPPGIDEDQLLEEGYVELEDILDWAATTAPVFASVLPTFLFEIFFPGRPYPPSRTAFDYPRLEISGVGNEGTSGFFPSPRSPLLFTFACLSSSLNSSYYRLYTSDSDGLSFNRLMNALLGYAGPTLLLIRDTDSNVFGAYTASPWKESKDFYGDSDCFLFSVQSDSMAVYRPTGKATNFMYCNSYNRSRGYDQQSHGIGFGGSPTQPRLFLSEGLDECRASGQDLTFENGSLLGKSRSQGFTVEALEVWAVGGDGVVRQALGARDRVRQIKEEGIRRARKVDKAQFLDDLRSGAIDSKAFQYRQQIDGRADQDVKERQGKAYDYEK